MNTSDRKVQLKTSIDIPVEGKERSTRNEPVHFDITSFDITPPNVSEYNVQDSTQQETLSASLKYLTSLDDQVFSWLEQDAKNAIQFINDPISALQEAIPDLDHGIIDKLKSVVLK